MFSPSTLYIKSLALDIYFACRISQWMRHSTLRLSRFRSTFLQIIYFEMTGETEECWIGVLRIISYVCIDRLQDCIHTKFKVLAQSNKLLNGIHKSPTVWRSYIATTNKTGLTPNTNPPTFWSHLAIICIVTWWGIYPIETQPPTR